MDLVGLAARLVLGVVLVVAGALKVTTPAVSAMAVRAYQLLPYDVAGVVGVGLPVVEIAAGLLMVLGLLTRPAAVVGGLLMLAFLVGIISAWALALRELSPLVMCGAPCQNRRRSRLKAVRGRTTSQSAQSARPTSRSVSER